VDNSTFTISLREPFGLVLDALAKPSGNVPFMMPERVAMTDPQKQIEDYTGSGPFKFVKSDFQPGVRAVYEKFKEYVPRSEPANSLSGGKRVYVDRVEWTFIPDHNTAIAALQSGEVDYYEDPPMDLLALVKNDPAITIAIGDELGFQGALRFNHLLPPFNNAKNRRALLYMINQEDVMRVVAGDPKYFKSCAAVFICGTPGASNAGAEDVKVNLDKAKELLKEGGYNGEKVLLMDPTDLNVLHSMAQAVVPMLRKGGLNVDVLSTDWSTIVTRRADKRPVAEGGWNIFITAATGADLITPMAHFHVDGRCDKGQPGWYCDAKMTELQDHWARATEPAQARALFVDMQREAYVSGAYVPLGQYQQPVAFRNLTGVVQAPIPVLWNIHKGQ
jgi:peptide/nickel transport system substrate-binding protein